MIIINSVKLVEENGLAGFDGFVARESELEGLNSFFVVSKDAGTVAGTNCIEEDSVLDTGLFVTAFVVLFAVNVFDLQPATE